MDAVLAPWTKNVSPGTFSPDHARYVVLERDSLTPLALMAKPFFNLGGLQIDPLANRSRALTTRPVTGMRIVTLADRKEVTVALPKGMTASGPTWSPNGAQLAFFAHANDGTFLYVADPKTGRTHPATKRQMLPVLATSIDWTADSKRIAVVVVPEKRAAMPPAPTVAESPEVKVADDKPNKLRTYPSLLSTPYDMRLLEYYATGQLALVDVGNGNVKAVGKPAMIESVSPGANGEYFRLTLMEKPFSYIVPMGSYPERDVIWDANGDQKTEISKQGLRTGLASDTPPANENAKRSLTWRPDGAGISFLQLVPLPPRTPGTATGGVSGDESDEQARGRRGGTDTPAAGPPRKDRVMLWVPPYGEKDVNEVYESDTRIGSVRYSDDGKLMFITQTVDGRSRLSVLKTGDPAKPVVLSDVRPAGDGPSETSDLVSRPGSKVGTAVVVSPDGSSVFMAGTQTYKDPNVDAPRPFLDRVSLADGKKERIFQSRADVYETAAMMDDNGAKVLVTRQSPTAVPNAFLVDLATKAETPVTSNRDYLPDLTQAKRDTFWVTRQDGMKFQVKVTLPPGWSSANKPPAFFWFYPSEFVDQAAYDRSKRSFNKNLFNGISTQNKVILIRLGYAVVEPDCPIFAPVTRMNDEYIPQLRNNLAATIDALEKRGYADRERLGIGGHSYGAFSTANALAHTPFFKAGIAGDGNYNRVLTPFGFQSEDRQLWEDREMYLNLSPILYAEQMTGALLMYHGLEDQNIGTDPTNSRRLFASLEALGKPSALYMYPYEDHGQIGRETILDEWARFVAWLDKWVKNPKADGKPPRD